MRSMQMNPMTGCPQVHIGNVEKYRIAIQSRVAKPFPVKIP